MDKRYFRKALILLGLLLFGNIACAKVSGCIVSHHLVAEPAITSVFEDIKNEKYSTVILIGPNHKNIGPYLIATSDEDWHVKNGVVEPDQNFIKALSNSGIVGVDHSYIKQEHSIFTILPFIRKYFPQAKVVPIMYKSYTTSIEAEKTADILAKLSNKNTLIIASVDFSHHATSVEARTKDRKSINVISSFDMKSIFSLNLDSKPSIYCLLSYLKMIGSTSAIFLKNANASDFVSYADPKDLTSYVFFDFQKDPVSVEGAFSHKKHDLSEYDKSKLVSILCTGDVMLGRSVENYQKNIGDYSYPFKNIKKSLKSADIRLINLEGPMAQNVESTTEGMTLISNDKSIEGLKLAGIDVVNLANNHILDNGISGFEHTANKLKEAGLSFCGQKDVAIKEVKGTRYSFIGFNCLSKNFDLDNAKQMVKKAKEKSDCLIVSMHCGDEYSYNPNSRQREFAKAFIDSGADLIIGNHPHFVQGIEMYKDRFIAYSHGNFVFDQNWSKEAERGVVGKYTFYKNALVDVSYYPIEIKKYRPQLADKNVSSEIINHMKDSSERLKAAN